MAMPITDDASVPAAVTSGGVTASQLLSSTASVDVVLLLALCSSGVLVLLPMRSALADQGVGPKDQSGLIATICTLFAQCYYWAVYGHLIGQYDIFHFNGFGAGMCLAYLWCLCRGSRNKHCRHYVMVAVPAMIGLSFCILGSALPMASKAEVCAYAAMFFSFLQSATPLVKAVEIIRHQNGSEFPYMIAVSSCISNMLWAEYAWLVHDRMYLLSNVLNTLVCGLSLFLATMASASFGEGIDRGWPFCDPDAQPLMPRTKRPAPLASPWRSWLSGHKLQTKAGPGDRPFGSYSSFSDTGYKDVEFAVHTKLDQSNFDSGLEEDQRKRHPSSVPMQVSRPRMSLDCVL